MQRSVQASDSQLPVLEVSGSPEDIGGRHGELFRNAIRRFAAERVELAGDTAWAGRALARDTVVQLADRCLESHERFAPELTAELRAMADAAGLSAAEMLIVSGFTDFADVVYQSTANSPAPAAADNCTAFLVPPQRAADGNGFFGQTWDMHESAADHVLLIRAHPQDALPFVVFTSVGCIGMIGMNAAGITIGINNLSGADGRVGVTWNFVVRQVLRQSRFDEALACITNAPLAGAHNYLLMDGVGRGANIEATATRCEVTLLEDQPLAHTNHCLFPATRECERGRLPQAQASSEARLARVQMLLAGNGALDMEALAAVSRDTDAICCRGAPPYHVATCGAVIANPGKRELWALRGLPTEQAYERFSVAG